MRAIFQREWHGFFRSSIGYIFSGTFIALCSFFFVNDSLAYQSADIEVIFSNINIIYLFLVAILTMGLLSAERSKRTDQLLLTSPVRVGQIVVAKYLAALWVFGITLILSLIYPMIFLMYGATSMREIACVYIGFFLLGASFVSIGLLVSALTKNQMVAAVITFGVLLVINYLDLFLGGTNFYGMDKVLQWIALTDQYDAFFSGILRLESVIYYISFIATLLFLTCQIIKHRQSSDRKLRVGNYIFTVLVIIAVILFDGIFFLLSDKISMKVDMTRNAIYEFSAQTEEVLDALEEDVTIYAMYPSDVEGELVGIMREYLARYEQMSDRIEVIYKDPYEEPAFVRKYGENIALGDLIIETGSCFKVITVEDIYIESSYSAKTYIDAEKEITSAISFLTSGSRGIRAYFVKGHGEYAGTDSLLAAELEKNGYVVGEINIGMEGIPEDTDLLIFLSPTADITAEERDDLGDYLLQGGSAAFVFSAGTEPLIRLNTYLSDWGITVQNDYIIESDPDRAYRSQTGVPVPAPEIQKYSITEKLIESGINFIAPVSCSLAINAYNAQEASVNTLLMTSEKSWGMFDLSGTSLVKKEGDNEGPLSVATIAENENGRIFVIGSLGAIETPGLLEDSSYCNGDFILNVCSYLTDKEDAFSIRPKNISAEKLTMTEKQISNVTVVVQYLMPGVILAAGLLVSIRRRYL